MSGQKRRRIWVGLFLIGLLAVYLTVDSRLAKGEDGYQTAGDNLEAIGEAYKLLSTTYFKSVEPEKLSTTAIEGMLEGLDPYTTFFDRRALEQLRIETRGKFGGLGITISLRGGDVPVVMSVIEETPADTAGLTIGDRITAIEGEPTSGKSLQDVVDVLRGDPGAGVTISIDRPGLQAPFDQPIIRARIGIRSVEVLENVAPEIGYVSMSYLHSSRFSENTGKELEEALISLRDSGTQGIILDLRGNPGGLLDQAVAVTDKFLQQDRVVVTTRGRARSQNQERRTREAATIDDSIPLVVLVDRRSASASEIVAGAIQDSDRGLILGNQTFGKGSVQTVRQIGRDKALKLTTAVYYTPSGRSIHNESRLAHRLGGMVLTVADTVQIPVYEIVNLLGSSDRREDAVTDLSERFGLDQSQADQVLDIRLDQLLGLGLRENANTAAENDLEKEFKTAGGRTVYGGGGITPDVEIEPEKLPQVVIAMIRSYAFFDFSVDYAVRHGLTSESNAIEVDEGVLEEFYTFLGDSTKTEFQYRTPGEIHIRDLEQSIHGVEKSEDEQTALSHLRDAIGREREAIFKKAEPFIKLEIEREMVKRLWGTKRYILASLKGDKQFQEAVRILQSPNKYKEKMRLAFAGN